METYFKIKAFIEFGLPVILVVLLVMWGLYVLTINHLKFKLMSKLGYEYHRGLGTNVAYEFQPRWVKGNIQINYRKIDSLKYSQIKEFVKSKETN